MLLTRRGRRGGHGEHDYTISVIPFSGVYNLYLTGEGLHLATAICLIQSCFIYLYSESFSKCKPGIRLARSQRKRVRCPAPVAMSEVTSAHSLAMLSERMIFIYFRLATPARLRRPLSIRYLDCFILLKWLI